ncbi:MAG: lipoprotein [Burkholderiales bacterium]
MMVRHFAAVAALACSACGIKGPLYLPPKPQAAPVAPATTQPPVAPATALPPVAPAAAQPPVEPGPSSPPPPVNTVPAEKKP